MPPTWMRSLSIAIRSNPERPSTAPWGARNSHPQRLIWPLVRIARPRGHCAPTHRVFVDATGRLLRRGSVGWVTFGNHCRQASPLFPPEGPSWFPPFLGHRRPTRRLLGARKLGSATLLGKAEREARHALTQARAWLGRSDPGEEEAQRNYLTVAEAAEELARVLSEAT